MKFTSSITFFLLMLVSLVTSYDGQIRYKAYTFTRLALVQQHGIYQIDINQCHPLPLPEAFRPENELTLPPDLEVIRIRTDATVDVNMRGILLYSGAGCHSRPYLYLELVPSNHADLQWQRINFADFGRIKALLTTFKPVYELEGYDIVVPNSVDGTEQTIQVTDEMWPLMEPVLTDNGDAISSDFVMIQGFRKRVPKIPFHIETPDERAADAVVDRARQVSQWYLHENDQNEPLTNQLTNDDEVMEIRPSNYQAMVNAQIQYERNKKNVLGIRVLLEDCDDDDDECRIQVMKKVKTQNAPSYSQNDDNGNTDDDLEEDHENIYSPEGWGGGGNGWLSGNR